jgi:hypothetical protein
MKDGAAATMKKFANKMDVKVSLNNKYGEKLVRRCYLSGPMYRARFRQKFTLEDAVEFHAFAPLEALEALPCE